MPLDRCAAGDRRTQMLELVMAEKVAKALISEKKILIDFKVVDPIVDYLKRGLVSIKKIFFELKIGSRVRAAFSTTRRFVKRWWLRAGSLAFIAVALANTATISENAQKVFDGAAWVWNGMNYAAIVKKEKEEYEEKESTRLYDMIVEKQRPLKLAVGNPKIASLKKAILDAYNAKPGSELALVALQQDEVVKLLRANSTAAGSANEVLDEMDQAIECRTGQCDTEAFDRDWSPALCRADTMLRGWIEYRRQNDNPSFVRAFTARVDQINCQLYLYGDGETPTS
jgi:hypothetical protein